MVAPPAAARWTLATALFVASLAAAPEATHAQHLHTVKQGQTLSRIARRYRVSVWDLALANGLKPKSRLSVGKRLEVPPKGVTYVRPGQTLSHVARAHGCSVAELKSLNRIRKTTRLREGQRLILPGYMPEEARDRDWGKPEVPGRVTLRRQDRAVTVQMVDAAGRVRLKGARALRELMRKDAEGEVKSVHPRLALLLARISDHFGGREIKIVSGFREAGGYTRESSRHIAGRAADIQVRGVPRRLIWDYCRTLVQTGCGYYPRGVFVHVDARERHGQWVDWSGPGGRPRYGTLRGPYTRRQRKNPNRPRVTRQISRPDELALVVEVIDRHDRVVNTFDERRVTEADDREEDEELDELAEGEEALGGEVLEGEVLEGDESGDGDGDGEDTVEAEVTSGGAE